MKETLQELRLQLKKTCAEVAQVLGVVCIDRDEMNCAADNLCVMTAKRLGRLTGHKARGEAVVVRDKRTGEIKKYRSIRRAAVGLCCSYQTMLDYMNGKVKNSVLNDYQIKKIREVKK